MEELVGQLIDALLTKQYGGLLAVVVCLLVWGIRNYGSKLHPSVGAFLKSDPGGTVLAFLTAFGAALGTVGTLSLAAVGLAAKTAFFAIGGYAVLKKFVLPLIKLVLQKMGIKTVQEVEKLAEKQAKEAVTGNAKTDLESIK